MGNRRPYPLLSLCVARSFRTALACGAPGLGAWLLFAATAVGLSSCDGDGVPCLDTGVTSDSLERTVGFCVEAIGLDVPGFNCDDGTLVPENHLSADAYPNQDCDAPNVLNSECDPGSRFQVVAQTSEAIVVAHCRKKGRGPSIYGDIAVIQYNKMNGATCFYQALEDFEPAGHDLPAEVTPPSEGNGAGKFPWLSPEDTAAIKCVHCHDNGPMIRSPYLAQLRDEPTNRLPGTNDNDNVWGPRFAWNKTQPYTFVGNDFQSWKVYEVSISGTGSLCLTCHRMGLATVGGQYDASRGTSMNFGAIATAAKQAHKNAHSPDSPIWMIPGQIVYDAAVEAEALRVQTCAQIITIGGMLSGCQAAQQYGGGDTCGLLPSAQPSSRSARSSSESARVNPVGLGGHACAAACEEQHPDGLRLYNNLKGTCACRGCSEACSQSVCIDKRTPTNACLPCVQEALRGDVCNQHSGLFVTGCLGTKECADLVACIEACDP